MPHGFDNQNTWHDGHFRHVPCHPEFVMTNVLVSNTDSSFTVLKDNRVDLFHRKTLAIVFSNFVLVGHNAINVIVAQIEDW